MRRRSFLKTGLASLALLTAAKTVAAQEKGPNILWISAEDISPDLGCYGDSYATTPHIDAFAEKAVRYDRAYSHSGVCAPTRSGIITGMYPTSIGTHHMRCKGVPPAGVKCFTEYLRAAGYYCTNNRKTDYQFSPPASAWDESNGKAHWRNRPAGAPFFSVMNFTVCHESQVRSRDPKRLAEIEALGSDRHDPAEAPVPPYHADTPATRRDWAQYYDIITLMDRQVGETLRQLEADGLAEDTIVWFWGDHGRGLTRGKRWLYESGTRVPLLIHVPEKWRAHALPKAPERLAPGVNDDLVCFLDFAPTLLSLANLPIPAHLQGQPFLGAAAAPARDYIYGARDRMDEAYDLIRTVRDQRFRYFRNYMPYVTYAQDIDYMNEMPMLQDLRQLHREGKLTPAQARWFAERKPLEELYDVEADPHELNNLVHDPAYRADLLRLRGAHEAWMAATHDVGLIPEPEMDGWREQNGVMVTAPPVARIQDGRLHLESATPGASITYRWEKEPVGAWHLYANPLPLEDGMVLQARGHRIGFKDSAEVTIDPGARYAPPEGNVASHPVDREQHETLLAELRALRGRDFEADDSVEFYLNTLKHPEAAMRYWALVLLHRWVSPERRTPSWTTSFEACLADPSAVVRVAAAHAVVDWSEGKNEAAVFELVRALTDSSQSVRLFAVIAWRDVGEAAEHARAALEEATRDNWGYVVNVAKNTLAGLVH